ncbi:MAG TPA: hypothetical protein VKA19_13070 [Alphaproteobacteria bacterium]|nr:hypothetical protein [Alphaproteobacteria bacterium]
MPTRVVKSQYGRERLIDYLREQPLPLTVTVAKGAQRSIRQNRLQRLWINEIAEQWNRQETPEEIRGYCKLTIGVPLLRHENEAFRQQYDAIVRPLPYEQKLAVMMEPLDLPITRIMTSRQKTKYLDGVYRHFVEQGVVLTLPPDDMLGVERGETGDNAGRAA